MTFLKDSKIQARDPRTIAKIFIDLFAMNDAIDQDKEHLYVMHLDARNRVKMVELVYIGTINGVKLHAREIYRRAIIEGACSIIMAHNHPSGEAEPSTDDVEATKEIHNAGDLLRIPLVDHIVFTKDKYFSFKNDRVEEVNNHDN